VCLSVGKNIVCTLSSLSFVTLFDSRHCPEKIAGNVNICDRAGSLELRPVPNTERNKDNKTLNYASTPLDANTLLAAAAFTYT
jgi:hypothetical protein